MLRWADLGQMLTQPHALPTSSRQGEKNKEKLMGQNKERERSHTDNHHGKTDSTWGKLIN